MATFMVGNPEAEHAGYTTEDHYRWICDRCFQDFRELFGWTVKAAANMARRQRRSPPGGAGRGSAVS